MKLPHHPQSSRSTTKFFLQATKETCEQWEAVREAVDEKDGKKDIAVAVDGSWQKQVFFSKNGVVTVTGLSGKVIDVEVFQNIFLSGTKPNTFKIERNFFEGYIKREVAGLYPFFQRSRLSIISLSKYLGRGTQRALLLCREQCFGDHCLSKVGMGHVMKKMGNFSAQDK
ncbi:hypothetical protein TNIN_476431 [Trichonephila inaurata madagascariensis]|uniref:Uncharacterized protein n=1 Tax=Trichonephila inaurata madagascariensis TaxID=2747483 RepID=A0A8X6K0R8_9ARAC|nr:hypothetical protein TNIN_476431 [Trichonephila inaurata madagascariensis]